MFTDSHQLAEVNTVESVDQNHLFFIGFPNIKVLEIKASPLANATRAIVMQVNYRGKLMGRSCDNVRQGRI